MARSKSWGRGKIMERSWKDHGKIMRRTNMRRNYEDHVLAYIANDDEPQVGSHETCLHHDRIAKATRGGNWLTR